MAPRFVRTLLVVSVAVGLLGPGAGTASGQVPFDPAYQVELGRGQVVAPTRIVGMGGAFVSIAEGAGAYELNPASAAIRHRYNKDEELDWDWALEAIVATGDSDFENNRRPIAEDTELSLVFGALGFVAQEFGFGVSVRSTSIQLRALPTAPTTNLSVATVSFVSGYNLLDGQLVMGGSVVLGTATANQTGVDLMRLSGVSFVVGGVARPKGAPYRFGFTYRSRSTLSPRDIEPGTRVANIIVPRAIALPAQITVGMSFSVGARANNQTATFGKREVLPDEVTPASRELATIAMDVVFTENAERAAGFQAWTENELQVAGEAVSIGFHVGVETEAVEDLLKIRLGGYFEPSRFENVGRIHGTAGLDLYLFRLIWDWRAAAAVDLALNYANVILSVGFWH